MRGELTNWAQAGTCGAEPTDPAAVPDTGPRLGDIGPAPARPGDAGPGATGLGEGLGDADHGPARLAGAGPGPAGLGEGLGDTRPGPPWLAAAVVAIAAVAGNVVAAVAGNVVAPVTATIASPADAPICRANTGNTGRRLDHPALRMNPPQHGYSAGLASR